MKKVGVLTFFRPINYGAVLQAYALTKIIESEFGYEAELIDFRSPKVEYYRNWFRPKEYIKLISKSAQFIKRIGSDVIYGKAYAKRIRGFDRFIETSLKVSKGVFWSEEELKDKAQDYDAYVVGSDLVWNPEMTEGAGPVFFHSYITDNSKIRMSYAASIGLTTLPEQILKSYAHWINKLDYVSVREHSAKKLLQPICRHEIEVVLDPVLLTTENDWNRFFERKGPANRGYVLAFMLEYSPLLMRTVEKVADENGFQIVTLDIRNYYGGRNVRNEWDADPAEFISLVHNASCVVTNSFHGCTFSLIFHKELWCIPHTTRGVRMTELLLALGLEDRIVSEEQGYTASKIDYEPVEEKLNSLRKHSFDYLVKALGG